MTKPHSRATKSPLKPFLVSNEKENIVPSYAYMLPLIESAQEEQRLPNCTLGDVGEEFPRSDGEDMRRGASYVPREVTEARRRGEHVTFNAKCDSMNCWYWQMQDGTRQYHSEKFLYEFFKRTFGGQCPICGNTSINGETAAA